MLLIERRNFSHHSNKAQNSRVFKSKQEKGFRWTKMGLLNTVTLPVSVTTTVIDLLADKGYFIVRSFIKKRAEAKSLK